MRDISARNLAAALVSLGADVESALLELASVAPSLDRDVRKALYYHCEIPKLRQIADRCAPGLHFIESSMTRPTCAMHAVDQVTRVLDDEDVAAFLRTRFSEFSLEALCRTS